VVYEAISTIAKFGMWKTQNQCGKPRKLTRIFCIIVMTDVNIKDFLEM